MKVRVACDCRRYEDNGHTTLYQPFSHLWICSKCGRIPKLQLLAHNRMCTECLEFFSSPNRQDTQCVTCNPSTMTWQQVIKIFHQKQYDYYCRYRESEWFDQSKHPLDSPMSTLYQKRHNL